MMEPSRNCTIISVSRLLIRIHLIGYLDVYRLVENYAMTCFDKIFLIYVLLIF